MSQVSNAPGSPAGFNTPPPYPANGNDGISHSSVSQRFGLLPHALSSTSKFAAQRNRARCPPVSLRSRRVERAVRGPLSDHWNDAPGGPLAAILYTVTESV
jgi:hypothetical protein